jgi:hypothetical protein
MRRGTSRRWAGQALAWGQEGHSIIAELAQHRLTPEAAAEVGRLLGLRTFVGIGKQLGRRHT